MNDRLKKAFGEAYDKLYDLNSFCDYAYKDELEKIEQDINKRGYKVKLNDRSQKFKVVLQ